MHAGKVLVTDTPAELVRKRGSRTLEDAFISYLGERGEKTFILSELEAQA